MKFCRFLRFRPTTILIALVAMLAFGLPLVQAQSNRNIPKNLNRGLRELVEKNQSLVAQGRAAAPSGSEASMRILQNRAATGVFRLHKDSQGRVLVNVHLDGALGADAVKKNLEAMGGRVTAVDTTYRNGVMSAFVPVGSATQIAGSAGVRTLNLVNRPMSQVGLTTTQGAAVLRTDVANGQGFTGKGTTVGLLSDSYNTAQFFGVTDTAAVDVGTGDLPNITTIPNGEGLKFLIELDPFVFGPQTDEGRGMAQVVHDVAPDAALCYATAFSGEVEFANNIRTLRSDPGCAADVIADDVEYFDEPMFSDGIVAQAVDDVTAAGAAYFSSAGNQAKSGYASDLRFISDAAARGRNDQTVDLTQIPNTIDTSGGFHNFDPTGGVNIAQPLFLGAGPIISLQWDDPFDASPNGITTDLDVLFFDGNGNYVSGFTVNDDNVALNEPIELFQLCAASVPNDPNHSCDAAVGVVQMVLVRRGPGTHLAKRVKYVEFTGGLTDLSGLITAQTPITFGHNSARGANGVAAYIYSEDPAVFGAPKYDPGYENYSSPGPVTIAFDKHGHRLKHAEIRLKPDIAATDGGNTTFFPEALLFGPGQDFDARFGVADGFPNFFGTSEAAPHAAGVAALMIQKAGGPGSISPQAVSLILKLSAPPRDTDVFFSQAAAGHDGTRVKVTAKGEDLASVGFSNNFFTVSFDSDNPADTLDSITIDLTGTGLKFDPVGHPVAVGTTTGPNIVSASPNAVSPTITVNFSGFTRGNKLSFGVDRDFIKLDGNIVESGGNNGDEVGGAALVANVTEHHRHGPTSSRTVFGVFRNDLDQGYQVYDGFGLIDAVRALRFVH